MEAERITESRSWSYPRGQVMKTPDDVAEMLRLKACGWGVKRIARELGCSRHTVKAYVAAEGVKPFKAPKRGVHPPQGLLSLSFGMRGASRQPSFRRHELGCFVHPVGQRYESNNRK